MQNTKISTLVNRIKLYNYISIVSVVWIIGLVIGKCVAQRYPWDPFSAEWISNSILLYPNGMLIMISPILIGCLACIISRRLLYIFLFFKAFSYAFVSTNLSLAFGDAGWLLQILLMSTDTVLTAVLLLFSLRSVGERFDIIMRNAAIAVIISSILVSVDLYFIIPFTSSLLNG